MNDRVTIENIMRRRMHGLYLSRRCDDLETLAHEMLGMHSWFYRNVPFSALIRDTEIRGWKTRLTKTWLYRGTLHGVVYDDWPELLALSAGEQKDRYFSWLSKAYGPATLADAVYFFGISKEDAKLLETLPLDDLCRLDYGGKAYYYSESAGINDIPELTLLSGFDPLIVSYTSDNRFSLPQEYKSKVILKSGICLPTIAVDGQVAGVWSIKKNKPVIEFFAPQPKRMESAAFEMVESIIWRTRDTV